MIEALTALSGSSVGFSALREQEARSVPTEQAERAVLVLTRLLAEVEGFDRAPDTARVWIGGWSTYSGERDPSLVHAGEIRAATSPTNPTDGEPNQ
jgi:hypothetical protein